MKKNRQQTFILAFNAFTVLLWIWFIVEFLSKGTMSVPNAMAEVFLLILVFYAGDKELHRWHHQHPHSTKRGEIVVLVWVTLAAVMFLVESLGGAARGFRVPTDLPLVAWSVIVIFLITEYLKSEFHRRGSR